MRIHYHVMSAPSPLGLLFLARSERGMRYLHFMDRKSLKRVIASHAAECPDAEWHPSLLELKAAVDQLDAYFSGLLRRFTLPLDPQGTPFQRQVWDELSRIPYAETRSYGEIARTVGQPRAARAVGLANHENPIAIVVPCHRVIGADGSLSGYGGGVQRKRWLLEHERRFAHLEARIDRSRVRIIQVASTPAPSPARAPVVRKRAARSPGAPARPVRRAAR